MGRSKALLDHPGGGTLIEHVVATASSCAKEVVILGDGADLPDALSSYRVLPDTMPEAGPLGGLCSLLSYAEDRWAWLLACDMPFVTAELATRLHRRADGEVDAVSFARDDEPGVLHATCAFYHPRMLPTALDELRDGRRSLQELLRAVNVSVLQATADEIRQLTNVNTPDDLARLG